MKKYQVVRRRGKKVVRQNLCKSAAEQVATWLTVDTGEIHFIRLENG